MKVLHVIPNAFDYFKKIHAEAFEILEEESEYGVEADAITIEYGTIKKKQLSEVKEQAPSKRFAGQESVKQNTEAWDYYDIINIHCPFFGEVPEILQWLKKHPEKFLVVTYHYDFQSPDFFGFFIKYYNYFYLPKLFKMAKYVAFYADRYDISSTGIKMLNNDEKVAVLGLVSEDEDIHSESIVGDLVMIYNSLMNN